MAFSGNLQNWNKYLCIIFEKVLTLNTARGKVSIVNGRKTFPPHWTDTALPRPGEKNKIGKGSFVL